jgi:uncharacterized protein
MNLLVTGSSGLIGSALVPSLIEQGHSVRRLKSARHAQAGDVVWNPPERGPEPAALEGIDAVIHLAGESIAARWTGKKKAAIRTSRGQATRALVASLLAMKNPPKVLISASAVGYYGDRGDEIVREDSAPGRGFLAEVCREWEAAAQPASQKGIRVVPLRSGMVLTPRGGALGKMLLPFRLGLAGRIASGRQYISWIALDDLISAVHFALAHDALRGPVNAVSPHPITNETFTKTLGAVLHRPTIFPLPAWAAHLLFGELAGASIVAGVRAEPSKLLQSGFAFRHPELKSALEYLLNGETMARDKTFQ